MKSKRLGMRYRSGRTPDWLKFKNPEAPAVKCLFVEVGDRVPFGTASAHDVKTHRPWPFLGFL